jgi:hypothetical protein
MAEIKKVVIEAGGKEFNLSVEEAKALRDILNSTFPEKSSNLINEMKAWYEEKHRVEKERITYVPYYPPIIIERNPQPWGPWITWCNGSGDAVYCSASNTATIEG